ncbi:Putative N-acetylmannosaminyltransferase [Pirellulimonas nuda]|uniref:N-acetylmannosaminyltransferase n=1 Tax=Pirellulimonas nuda TaxID=2528009 RepID=A0A518DEW4_9BACT|nr:WecB/TagA/CpsF family glycosyltransferase [Pirellulimonas nuda]QDU90007.1 Putative N-acetylmannosaminyltransferase [Pirellulimonas nuda]
MITDTLSPRSAPPRFDRATVVGVGFDVCDYDSVVAWLGDSAYASETARYVCVSNVADVMDAKKDTSYASALAASALTVPDGAPVVWAMRKAGWPIRKRVYGPTLMERALESDALAERRHVLIGGSTAGRDGVRRRFPEVNWVGELDFRYDQLDDAALAELANQYAGLQPDYAWVSLGGGKQVRFMHRFAPLAPPSVLLGVGAAFDFHAGLTRQAPRWMQEGGLEWLFRLGVEPRRLWRRYLLHNPPFLYHWAREAVRPSQPKR